MFTRKIELEKRRVAELDKQIQQMNGKVRCQVQATGRCQVVQRLNYLVPGHTDSGSLCRRSVLP